MKWFGGSIREAISLAQSQKYIFVAYVEGSCNQSKTMASVLGDKDVLAEFEKNMFVCVKLEANSIGYKQLVETYRSVPVPSLCFISHYGQPLDIVEGSLYGGFSEMRKAILEAAEFSMGANALQEPPLNIPGDKLLEERRQQVVEILEKKRAQVEGKKEKQEDKEKLADVNSEMSDPELLKKKQQDNELKKLADEREKERREDAKARQRILEQIAMDKAERAEKLKNFAGPNPLPSKAADAEKPGQASESFTSSAEARIQFKLPTGESKLAMFPKTTKLIDIRKHIDQNLQLSFRDYRLATTFPRREFTSEDHQSSLEDLNLVPTAVLLILPNSSGMVNPLSGNWFNTMTGMVKDLLHPLYSIANYLRGLIFRRRDGQDSGAPQPSSSSSSQQQQSPAAKTYVRKSGNIHSLRDLRDDNDENNTWNGNSTQQM